MTLTKGRGFRHRPRSAGPISLGAAAAVAVVSLFAGCGRSDPALRPDSVLQAELGLTDGDRVHRVVLRGGAGEEISPAALDILEGDWVQFSSADWRVHEVRFEVDSLSASARSFLEGSDQHASPPLVDQGDRFLVSFAGAPEGRYPFLVEGNGTPVRGVVVVGPKR